MNRYDIKGTSLIVEPLLEEEEERREEMAGEYECRVTNGYSPIASAAHLSLPVVAPRKLFAEFNFQY